MIIKENLLKLEKINLNKTVIIACADNGYVGTGLVHCKVLAACVKKQKTQILG